MNFTEFWSIIIWNGNQILLKYVIYKFFFKDLSDISLYPLADLLKFLIGLQNSNMVHSF
jgi:hypothetical protein